MVLTQDDFVFFLQRVISITIKSQGRTDTITGRMQKIEGDMIELIDHALRPIRIKKSTVLYLRVATKKEVS